MIPFPFLCGLHISMDGKSEHSEVSPHASFPHVANSLTLSLGISCCVFLRCVLATHIVFPSKQVTERLPAAAAAAAAVAAAAAAAAGAAGLGALSLRANEAAKAEAVAGAEASPVAGAEGAAIVTANAAAGKHTSSTLPHT